MGASKSDHFTEEQNELASLFKALGHPARIAIIQHILETKSCICGDLVERFPLSQATISQHLKELKSANIIQGTIEGNSICYCLNPQTLSIIHQTINVFIEADKCKGTNCC
jgi:ArsR family transcriptional regulator, arsenate/arsenite/antimonite-responsive transcriptional repressor